MKDLLFSVAITIGIKGWLYDYIYGATLEKPWRHSDHWGHERARQEHQSVKKIKEAACHCVELFYFKIDRYYYVKAYQWTLDKEVGGVKCVLSCIKLSPHRNLSILFIYCIDSRVVHMHLRIQIYSMSGLDSWSMTGFSHCDIWQLCFHQHPKFLKLYVSQITTSRKIPWKYPFPKFSKCVGVCGRKKCECETLHLSKQI